jgi:hypothetical protein
MNNNNNECIFIRFPNAPAAGGSQPSGGSGGNFQDDADDDLYS